MFSSLFRAAKVTIHYDKLSRTICYGKQENYIQKRRKGIDEALNSNAKLPMHRTTSARVLARRRSIV